jgi:hypothetical protein
LKPDNKDYLFFYLFAWILLLFSSCGDKGPQIDSLAADLANFECRAEKLKDLRFQLADKIRFTQDTMLHTAPDTMQMHNDLLAMDQQKQMILTQSLQLADTIKQKLDFIRANYFTDKSKEATFNQLLKDALKTKDCK